MISGINMLINIQNKFKVWNKQKVFCIGLNKTGTTSLNKAMLELGYVCGNQNKAEELIHAWAIRDFKEITNYCYSAQFFQDIPFSLSFTYINLDQAFPGSKFILTVRDDAEEWFNSLSGFHSKLWGKDNKTPTKEDLKNAFYRKKGWPWEVHRLVYNTPENDLYNRKQLIDYYNQHNKNIIEYFRHRSGDLLILNVADKKAYTKLCDFLNIKNIGREFPWENKTY